MRRVGFSIAFLTPHQADYIIRLIGMGKVDCEEAPATIAYVH